jgi:acyl carrier protein
MATMTKAAFLSMVEEILELPAGQLTGTEFLASFNWDSLAVVAFLGAVDEKVGVSVSPQQIRQCATVDDLANLLQGSIVG